MFFSKQCVVLDFLRGVPLCPAFPQVPGRTQVSREAAELGPQCGRLHCTPPPGLDPSPRHVLVGGGSDHSSSENVVSVRSAYCPLLKKTKVRWPAKINSLCVCSRGHHFLKNSSDSKDK